MQRLWLLASLLALLLLSSTTVMVTAAGNEEGFVSLFDGKTLDGWVGSVDGYEVIDGAIACIPDKGGNLYTKDEYANFVLRFEFRLPPGATVASVCGRRWKAEPPVWAWNRRSSMTPMRSTPA